MSKINWKSRAETAEIKLRLTESALDQLQQQFDDLQDDLRIAIEAQRCECSTDEACRFARERDQAQQDVVRAVGNRYGNEAFPEMVDAAFKTRLAAYRLTPNPSRNHRP